MLTPRRFASLLPACLVTIVALAAGLIGASSLRPAAPPVATDAVVAAAQGDQDADQLCPPGQRDCEVEDHDEETIPRQPGDGDDHRSGGQSGCFFNNGSGVVLASLAAQDGMVEVPCVLDGAWYDGTGCYYGEPDFNWNRPPPDGKTEEDGRYYGVHCLMSVSGEIPNQVMTFNALRQHAWVDFDEVPEATPQQVVNDWLATIGLDGVEFALAPPATGAGLVGLPVWLGIVENPNSWGPIEASHCIGDVCVEISAGVTEVRWEMGDGTVVTCARDEHQLWRSGMDFRAPAGCHHIYDQTSRQLPDRRYQITATSLWQVNWSRDAAGDSGVIPTERDATTSVQIDEIQVLRNR